ncbi:hypothetical protein D9M71_657350 [compost metagenome]
MLAGQVCVGKPENVQHLPVEARFNRSDRHVLAVAGFVGVVPGRTAIKQVAAALFFPVTTGQQAPDHRAQLRRTFGHRRVDHLPGTAAMHIDQRRQYAHRQQHAATAVVTHQVQRRHRPTTGRANTRQHTRQGDVVQVMACAVGHRAGLAPAGHTAVDQARIAL